MSKLRGEYYAEQFHTSVALCAEHREMLLNIQQYYGFRTKTETIRFLIVQKARGLKRMEGASRETTKTI